jgi:hypothetical protein
LGVVVLLVVAFVVVVAVDGMVSPARQNQEKCDVKSQSQM